MVGRDTRPIFIHLLAKRLTTFWRLGRKRSHRSKLSLKRADPNEDDNCRQETYASFHRTSLHWQQILIQF
jgi:hypothetical protein